MEQVGNGGEKRRCFFVAAIGHESSPERRHSDFVLEQLLRPTLEGLGFTVYRGDESHKLDIHSAIIEDIATVPLVIADLTFANPNVMFELGMRLAWCLPAVLIAHERYRRKLSFDVQGLRVVFFNNSRKKADHRKMRERIKKAVLGVSRRSGTTPVFDNCFANLAKPLGATVIHREARLALHDLLHALHDIEREIEHEIAPDKPDALPALDELLGGPFATLDDKKHLLRGIQLNLNDPQLEDILTDCEAILAEWKRFHGKLLVGEPGEQAVAVALRWVKRSSKRISKAMNAIPE